MANTVWCGFNFGALYLQSGEFTGTLKTSVDVSSTNTVPRDVDYDGVDSPWIGQQADTILYINSGQFTSTVKDSLNVESVNTNGQGISSDDSDLMWSGQEGNKFYHQSGKVSSTIKTSGTAPSQSQGIAWDGTDMMVTSNGLNKMMLYSGRFTTTVKTSIASVGDTDTNGIGWNGTDTLSQGWNFKKLYRSSGRFTSTVKDSQIISGIDTAPNGIETDDYFSRLNITPPILPTYLTLTLAQNAPAILGVPETMVINAPLALTLAGQPPTVSMDGSVVIFGALSLFLAQESTSTLNDLFTDIQPNPCALTMSLGVPVVGVDAVLLKPNVSVPGVELLLALGVPEVNTSNDARNVVTNTRNFAISEYSNFAFNSMAKFNDKFLYARADGIYEGGGSNDNGTNINASYKTGVNDIFATEIQKLRDAYLNFRSDGDVQFFSVGDELNTRQYNIANSANSTIHERRVKFERGIRDRHFNFGISNINGSDFEVKSARVLTEPIRKRR